MNAGNDGDGTVRPEQEPDEQIDEEDDRDLYPPPAATHLHDISKMEIDVKEVQFSVKEIVQKILKKQFVLTPDFQRKEVWKIQQRSAFIESLLLNYPLPPLYLNQDSSGRYLVVDGLQRSSTLDRFLKDEFPLTGLEKLSWLNGQRFSQLDPMLQSRIEDAQLRCYLLKAAVPIGTIYDIFARINRGGTQLTRQEIRHGILQGAATKLLRRLAEASIYRDWIGRKLHPERMGDEEAALRCIAFRRAELETEYRGNMDDFLNAAMRHLNNESPEVIKNIENEFLETIHSCHAILGTDAFRIPTRHTRGVLNMSVLESVYRYFASQSKGFLTTHAATIRANYQQLIVDSDYHVAVRWATGNVVAVKQRFRLVRERLGVGCAY